MGLIIMGAIAITLSIYFTYKNNEE